MKIFVLTLALVMYALIIAFQGKKSLITAVAALIVTAASVFIPQSIFGGVNTGETLSYVFTRVVNWNVLMIYVGSMIIASLFIYSQIPTRIADILIDSAPNTGIAIILILVMTGIISIFAENVATVLVMAPIALALCRKLKADPTYFMIGLAVMSNLEGTATLIGDPPSMIFASFAGYNFNDFFFHEGRPSIFFIVQTGMLAGCAFFYTYFSKNKESVSTEKQAVVSYFPGILLGAMILGLALLSLSHAGPEFLSGLLVLFLGVAGIVWFKVTQKKSARDVVTLVKGLDWETITFLIGIFIVVGAVAEIGLLDDFAAFLSKITRGNKFSGFMLILFVSILISGFIDNVPYIIGMLPVAQALAHGMNVLPELYMFALLVGSCLGGNLTPFGASANVVAIGILKKEGRHVSFFKWIKVGVSFTLITTGASSILLWVLYGML
ncbi:TRAP transporter large permease subunit [Treponema parvum]|uniref:TRAP transporter large permease subunit n=1 Tax=Treponema parvum TaxID=138851 RepID=A0A975F5E8_9SPIR|nr:SLC13 family permease [Treponema parvum]QTQ14786.1 TRAP transporter large permease subunit [Treponema parvum]